MAVFDLSKRRSRAVRPHPIFLAFVALTVIGGWISWATENKDSQGGDFGVFLFVVAAWVVTLCLHEFGHAYVAFRAGDRDVEAAGYLTLNPLKYSHPVLSFVIPLLFIVQGGIGLPGGAVYLHPHRFRSKAMQSLAAVAGPASNAIIGIAILALAKANADDLTHLRFWSALAFLGFLQLTAAVLNLLPIPGLDGYAIIEPYQDANTRQIADKVKPWGMIGVIVLLQVDSVREKFFDLVNWIYDLFGPDVFGARLWPLGHELFRFWRQKNGI